MARFNIRSRPAVLAACSALAVALMTGCAGHGAVASSAHSAAALEADLAGQDKNLVRLEQRVAKAPRNASARFDLAKAYLAAGRFQSAATTFDDVIALGDDRPQAGLGQALAYIGSGRNAEALQVLDRVQGRIPAEDFGLAVALAGQPERGVALLTDSVRSGGATAKTRQNLAYAYALAGRWSEARLIAAQDVPANQLDARMDEWASRSRNDQFQSRIAGLIGAPVRGDDGQPAALALNGVVDGPQLAAAAPVPAPASASTSTSTSAPVPGPAAAPEAELPAMNVTRVAMADPAPASRPAARLVPVARPAALTERAPAPDRFRPILPPALQAAAAQPGSHLVQLGAFSTRDGARRAWTSFVTRNPVLRNHAVRITEATVRGQRYFRVAAEGFNLGSARSLCSSVRQRGGGCLAYADPGRNPAPAGQGAAARLARR